MPDRLRIERDGPVARIVFDHPERRNAITAAMWREIPEVARRLDEDDEVRVVEMRGSGDLAFVSGADISEFEDKRRGAAARHYEADNWAAFDALAAIRKPVVAAIHGFCIGGGCALALTADLRYCADDAVFAIPAARLGVGYDARGIDTLVRTVGLAAAKEIFLTARRFDAREALASGLVHRVLPKSELDSFVTKTVESIAENAPLTLRAAKLAFASAGGPRTPEQVDAIRTALATCFASADYGEGVRAFLDKRPPRFKGR